MISLLFSLRYFFQFCELQWQGNANKEEPVVMKDCKSLSSRVRVRSKNDYRCSIVLRYMVEQVSIIFFKKPQ